MEPEAPVREKADPDRGGHVAAPMTGIVTLAGEAGETVEAGQRLGTIEAMKMQSKISAPAAGTVERLGVTSGTHVEPRDLSIALKA